MDWRLVVAEDYEIAFAQRRLRVGEEKDISKISSPKKAIGRTVPGTVASLRYASAIVFSCASAGWTIPISPGMAMMNASATIVAETPKPANR